MLIRDEKGFILDNSKDGGDSANRGGLLALAGGFENLDAYVDQDGWCVRHPYQYPWNNKYNFSRDQLIPFTAGLWKQEKHKTVRKIFWAHARRLFFAQNFQRDFPGSWKFPWPHSFTNDKGENETRSFDFADPLLPDSIWHLICCGRIYALYWFGIIGIPWFVLSLWVYCRFNDSDDEGQIISQCRVQGQWAVDLYYSWRSGLYVKLSRYWVWRRNQEEIYNAVREILSKN